MIVGFVVLTAIAASLPSVKSGHPTKRNVSSVNLVFPDGRRKNFYDGRGQMDAEPDLERCRAWLRGRRVLHAQLENWCRRLLPLARRLGVLVSVDLQDVVTLDDPYRREFLDLADVVFFSTVNFPEPEAVVEGWLEKRPNRVVIGGMGARGGHPRRRRARSPLPAPRA